jgi:apolipoprotein N-acyltransferase
MLQLWVCFYSEVGLKKKKKGWLYSLPRRIRLCREKELQSVSQTDLHFNALVYLPVPLCLIFLDDVTPAQYTFTDLVFGFRLFLSVGATYWSHLFCGESMMIHIPSFAVSTLVSFILMKHSSNTKQLYSPSAMLNPKRHSRVWAAICVVRWLQGGGWHNASWNDLPLDVWSSFKMNDANRLQHW